jgi:proteic killer suppression protein
MHIWDNKLKRTLRDATECKRRYGAPMAKKIGLRLDALEAAESLADFWPPYSGPERCHELKGSLAGTFSVDVKQPYRLLFEPRDTADEGESGVKSEVALGEQQRWTAIRSIELTGIEDTHG